MKVAFQHRMLAFLAGLFFGVGLLLSGMTNPMNIRHFLDVTGHWDPALAVVMVSAITVAAPAFAWMKKRQRTFLGDEADLSNRKAVEPILILGAALFGVGWGLSGLCPGPGLMVTLHGPLGSWLFILAMSVGLWLGPMLRNLIQRRPGTE